MANNGQNTTGNSTPGGTGQANPRQLREAALRIEEELLPSLYELFRSEPQNTTGDLKIFPRPSREDQAALAGIEVLREAGQQLALVLNTLATAVERDHPVSPVLLSAVQQLVTGLDLPREPQPK